MGFNYETRMQNLQLLARNMYSFISFIFMDPKPRYKFSTNMFVNWDFMRYAHVRLPADEFYK